MIMLLKKHFWKMFLELSMFYGTTVFGVLIYMELSGRGAITVNVLWAILLLILAIGFRLESFVNFHSLDDHLMRVNYLISSVLADVTLIALLYFFTPGGRQFQGKGWMLLSVYVVLKGLFYLAMHLQSVFYARKINAVLQEKRVLE